MKDRFRVHGREIGCEWGMNSAVKNRAERALTDACASEHGFAGGFAAKLHNHAPRRSPIPLGGLLL
jgi:hypothetical protein